MSLKPPQPWACHTARSRQIILRDPRDSENQLNTVEPWATPCIPRGDNVTGFPSRQKDNIANVSRHMTRSAALPEALERFSHPRAERAESCIYYAFPSYESQRAVCRSSPQHALTRAEITALVSASAFSTPSPPHLDHRVWSQLFLPLLGHVRVNSGCGEALGT